mmetsp:Transcript_35274/g.75309  ORF Transcript_35274/g.75309 Transcript_35274/m.75309 type:complete len:788 (+) Transcript_35274:203-2566(+)
MAKKNTAAAATDSNDSALFSQLLAFAGHSVDADVARRSLEMGGNSLEAAVGLFVDMDDDSGGGVGGGALRIEESGREARGEGGRAPTPASGGGGGGDNVGDLNDSFGDGDDKSLTFSEPDYDFLADYDDDGGEVSDAFSDDVPSSPDYDHLGPCCVEELSSSLYYAHGEGDVSDIEAIEEDNEGDIARVASSGNKDPKPMDTARETWHDHERDHAGGGEEDGGEEYILGTLMVRVLQAKNLKHNPNSRGGGISGLIFNHRRFRYQKSTMSPLSGGNLTPSSYYANQDQQIYAKLSYRKNPPQFTSVAYEHAHGDYHWSRGDQSYFDVTCQAYPSRMGDRMPFQHPPSQIPPALESSASPREDAPPDKTNTVQRQLKSSKRRPPPPTLQLSLYSKKSTESTNQNKQNKWLPYLGNNEKDNLPEKNEDYLLGKCSINVLRILSGKTPYFDEWCTLHDDNHSQQHQRRGSSDGDGAAGRVRIVVEYEPSDPPPRPGDKCVFANACPLADELYPIPLHSMCNVTRPARSSSTLSSVSFESSSSRTTSRPSLSSSLICRPKRYLVEEVVGDHVILSYRTPAEGWTCTFEVHRYLLLCVECHVACVEKYRERVLDLCDNVSHSPAMGAVIKTVETLPDEGLVHVGSELVVGGVGLLERWWENGVEGLVEDVVDGINLDGRYSCLSCDEEEKDGHDNFVDAQSLETGQDEKKALPGMSCCPITGLAMVEPVVAADGHTYERHAISRWLQTSDLSPLTGEVLAHLELVPNYLLMSSLSNNQEVEWEDGNEYVNHV